MSEMSQFTKLIIKAHKGDVADLAHLARVVSHNLFIRPLEKAERLEFMDWFRNVSVNLCSSERHSEYTHAYFEALLAVVDNCRCALKEEIRRENDLKFVWDNKEKFELVMNALASKPMSFDEMKAAVVGPQISLNEMGDCMLVLIRYGMVSNFEGHPHGLRFPYGVEVLKRR